jgi:hypothetical protein
MFLHDNRIIQQHQGLQVHAQRLEVMFRDGSAVTTHPVARGGLLPEPLLRAVQLEGLHWLVVDLGALCPALSADAARLPARDTFGLCFFHLRQAFGTADAFIAAARVAAAAHWWRGDVAAQAAAEVAA